MRQFGRIGIGRWGKDLGFILCVFALRLDNPSVRKYVASKEAIIGFRLFELPFLICSIVKLFGRCPGLIILMRSEKINSFTGANIK